MPRIIRADDPNPTLRTVVVLGASYAGYTGAQTLAALLPKDWRVVVIERNTHANHLYAFPRMAVIKNLEHKAFIPYTTIFNPESQTPKQAEDSKRHLMIHGCVKEIGKNSLKYVPLSNQGKPIVPITPPADLASQMDEQCGMGATCCKELSWRESEKAERTLQFDYMVYAFGSHLPAPINIWSTVSHNVDVQIDRPQACQGSKERGRAWLKAAQSRIEKAKSIAVIGGGALGVQFATDIAAIHGPGNKKVTLIHSRKHLLNRFETYMHDGAMEKLTELKVEVILGARVDMSHLASREADHGIDRVIRTMDGREFEAELVLFCTGQKPNSQLLASLHPESINPNGGMITVNRHLQIAKKPSSDSQESDIQLVNKHIFVVGDTVDAFGALQAGHTAWAQARLACRNIARLVEAEKPVELRRQLNIERQEWEEAESLVEEVLESYTPPRPSIKVSLGLDSAISQNDGVFSKSGKESCQADLYSEIMWTSRGLSVDDMTI
ncbi:hypothetical protein QFC21_001196 [Naganishia friedmannii]|uniref:Uncharacterized protein n=1 Tax=Naganishia friedmannii TaxID=89922 RepID=A0ACC2W8U7_9TREE|nr:hypothetical protein QFC21_001196 [Naganishia friedmannii]